MPSGGICRPLSFVVVLDGCVRVLVVGGAVVRVQLVGEHPRGEGVSIEPQRSPSLRVRLRERSFDRRLQ